MTSSFLKSYVYFVLVLIILIIFIPCFFIPIIKSTNISSSTLDSVYGKSFTLNSNNFLWPVPGYTRISSSFGYRKAPTSGASTYHSGIDIPAPTGSNLIAIFSGIVTFTGFKGAGGYSITIKSSDFTVSYCHVSPKFIVNVGEFVARGNIIGNVGPKNVYGIDNNPYKDKNGNPTNGATTGPHLHLTIKLNGENVNPLNYF